MSQKRNDETKFATGALVKATQSTPFDHCEIRNWL